MAPWFNWWGSSDNNNTKADFGISNDGNFDNVSVSNMFTCPRVNVTGDLPPPATPTNLNSSTSINPGRYMPGSIIFNEGNNSLYVCVSTTTGPAWAGITSTL